MCYSSYYGNQTVSSNIQLLVTLELNTNEYNDLSQFQIVVSSNETVFQQNEVIIQVRQPRFVTSLAFVGTTNPSGKLSNNLINLFFSSSGSIFPPIQYGIPGSISNVDGGDCLTQVYFVDNEGSGWAFDLMIGLNYSSCFTICENSTFNVTDGTGAIVPYYGTPYDFYSSYITIPLFPISDRSLSGATLLLIIYSLQIVGDIETGTQCTESPWINYKGAPNGTERNNTQACQSNCNNQAYQKYLQNKKYKCNLMDSM